MRFLGIRFAEAGIFSEQARVDHRELLSKAQRMVRLASEQIEDVELLDQLAVGGVKIELVVGPTQDKQVLARLEEKGANITQLDTMIERPITIVDGSHARVVEGRDTQDHFVVYNTKYIREYNQMFEDLSTKAHKLSVT